MNKGIDTLIAAISKEIDGLKNGTLTVSELNELTEKSRELYEILVVLRFSKASGSAPSQNTPSTQTIEPELTQPVEKEATAPVETSNDDILFDFSSEAEENKEQEIDLFAPVSTPTIEPTPQPTSTQEQPPKQSEEAKASEPENTPEEDASINTNYHGQFSDSIANKMQLQPIRNLAGHISLNQRFIFISNLFGNNAELYNQQIAEIDLMPNGAAAKERLNELKNQHQWDLENDHVIEFVTLTERRFL